jgi:sugar lactone lactonase YvrE
VVYFVDGDRVRRIGSNGRLATVAGTGTAGSGGDGGAAQLAQLNFSGGFHLSPVGMAFDSLGNLFLGDAKNHRVRKVTPEGTIATVAGTGTAGFSGDGGAAVAAQLNTPRAVAIDRFGNLYICDTENNRVRKIDTSGTITTVAGTGVAGFSGDDGPAEVAQLDNPQAVVVGVDGNIFVADTDNQRIREIGPRGRITTVAGTGRLGFSGDGGPATSARLSLPDGVAMASNGLLYIADTQNNRIRVVDLRGTISTFAGSGTPGFVGEGGSPTTAQLDQPIGVALTIRVPSTLPTPATTASGALRPAADDGRHGVSSAGAPRDQGHVNCGCAFGIQLRRPGQPARHPGHAADHEHRLPLRRQLAGPGADAKHLCSRPSGRQRVRWSVSDRQPSPGGPRPGRRDA